MKTEVIMQRGLFGHSISQKSKSEFFSATDLVKSGNMWRAKLGMSPFSISQYWNLQGTKDFMKELESEFGKIKVSGRGRGSHTWVHPYLFIDIALAINPKLKIEVYNWLYDFLLKYRNSSGDSYKKMCGSLYKNATNKSEFHRGVQSTASIIKRECGVSDWQSATEDQLKLRDRIHENISLLADVLKDNNQAIRIGIFKAKEEASAL